MWLVGGVVEKCINFIIIYTYPYSTCISFLYIAASLLHSHIYFHSCIYIYIFTIIIQNIISIIYSNTEYRIHIY